MTDKPVNLPASVLARWLIDLHPIGTCELQPAKERRLVASWRQREGIEAVCWRLGQFQDVSQDDRARVDAERFGLKE